jgi:hypothetical protein
MLQAPALESDDRTYVARGRGGADQALSAIVYRSRAVQPLSGTELHWLTQVAQARNREEGITGLIVYHEDVFYQWLEGPRDSVARVMESIRHDRRHTDLEVLSDQRMSLRAFTGWPMKLATSQACSAPWQLDAIEAPVGLMCDLRDHPDFAPALLMKMRHAGDGDAGRRAVTAQSGRQLRLVDLAAPILNGVICAAVIPELLSHHTAGPGSGRAAQTRAADLAHLLVAVEPEPAVDFLRELRAQSGSAQIFAGLVEPASNALGNLWYDDACSEFDVTLGLCRLQTAIRQFSTCQLPGHQFSAAPLVLVAPEPGERHVIGAALDSDTLLNAGWSPHCAFPATDADLEALLAASWFDVLDLSLSLAFRREHWLPRVTATIAKARRASLNPGIVIVVSGRVFTETRNAGAQVGANGVRRAATNIADLILQRLSGAH